jgi:hypothetical protein
MRATTKQIRYTNHKNLDNVVNDLRYAANHRKTLVGSSKPFTPPALPFNYISIDRVKKEYVVMLHSFF